MSEVAGGGVGGGHDSGVGAVAGVVGPGEALCAACRVARYCWYGFEGPVLVVGVAVVATAEQHEVVHMLQMCLWLGR